MLDGNDGFVGHQVGETPPADAGSVQEEPVGCGLWLLWTGGTAIGVGVGWPLGWWLTYQLPGELASVVLGLPVGVFCGILQAWALGPILKSAGWWIAATAIGWTLGFFIGVEITYLGGLGGLGFGAAVGAIVGLVVGFSQMLVLRGRLAGSGWWVAINLAAWIPAFLFYRAGGSLMGVVYGLVAGSISGLVLVSLQGRSQSVAL